MARGDTRRKNFTKTYERARSTHAQRTLNARLAHALVGLYGIAEPPGLRAVTSGQLGELIRLSNGLHESRGYGHPAEVVDPS